MQASKVAFHVPGEKNSACSVGLVILPSTTASHFGNLGVLAGAATRSCGTNCEAKDTRLKGTICFGVYIWLAAVHMVSARGQAARGAPRFGSGMSRHATV